MYNSNIIALVFEDKRNEVVIWDNQEKICGVELTL